MVDAVHAQADTLAARLCGHPARVSLSAPATRLKIEGLSVFSGGELAERGPDDIVIHDPANHVYRRLMFRGANLIGAVAMGSNMAIASLRERIGTAVLPDERERLAFGLGG